MPILLKWFCEHWKSAIHSSLVLPNISEMVRFWILLLFSGVLSALYMKSMGPCLCSEHSAESLYRSCSADPQIAQPAAALLFRTAAALQRVLLGRDQCEVDSELGSVLQQGVLGGGVVVILTPHWSREHSTKQDWEKRRLQLCSGIRGTQFMHSGGFREYLLAYTLHTTLCSYFFPCAFLERWSVRLELCSPSDLAVLEAFPRLPSTEGLLVACISFTPLHQLLHNLVMVVNMSSGDGDGGRGCEIFS